METYGKILLFAMPAFLILIIFEKVYGLWRGNDTLRSFDTLSSISSGLTNVTKDVLGLSFVVLSYPFLVNKMAIFEVNNGFWTYLIAFLALDFSGYWVHRISHKNNFFWNSHLIHHSSEDFNLACALRQSISSFVKLFTIFLLPAALMGVPVQVVATVAPIHLFVQFWYHTQHIGRMGWLEQVLVTPSHHRVHHAINPEYIDKNFAQVLIIWDKLFGTFQEELPEVKPVYGITLPVRTWNPIKINFIHLGNLIRDSWATSSWEDKFKIWWMPTGWRPADVSAKFPLKKIEDVYSYQKYETQAGILLKSWLWFQFFFLLGLVSYLFANIAQIGSPDIFSYGIFIFLQVYAYSELMDLNPFAWVYELLKSAWMIFMLIQSPQWFGLNQLFSLSVYFLWSYAVFSVLITFYFCRSRIPD